MHKIEVGDRIFIAPDRNKLMVVTKISLFRRIVTGTRFIESGYMGDFTIPMKVVKLYAKGKITCK